MSDKEKKSPPAPPPPPPKRLIKEDVQINKLLFWRHNMVDIDKFAEEVYDFTVNEMGWKKDWSNGGCYIHLEASEFIEALRCKGDPVDELGDLFMCILSVCRNYNIKPSDAIEKSRIKMAEVLANKEKYLIKSSKHI